MKKLSFILVLVLLLQLCSVSAYAADTKHFKLEELDMEMDIPADYVVFTRDIDSSDRNLQKYGLTKGTLLQQFENSNIYLDAWNKDARYEILVTMTDSVLDDYNLLSDTVLNTLSSSTKSLFKDMGYECTNTNHIQQEKQAKFLDYFLENANEKIFCHEYNTVYAGKTINISFFIYTDKKNLEDYLFEANMANDIIDSVKFGTAPQKKPAPEYTPSFEYKDSVTGLTFTVPEYWLEVPLSKEREIIVAKFASQKEDGLSIMYGRSDIWSEMSASERAGLRRADVDNSLFTEEDLSSLSGAGISRVTKTTLGGKEYFRYTYEAKQNLYGLEFDVAMTVLTRIENGYMYQFQFSGLSNPYYKDFETLVSSVQYPEVKNPIFSGAAVAVIVLMSAALVLVLISIFIIRKKEKTGNSKKETPPVSAVSESHHETAPAEQVPVDSAATEAHDAPIFCIHCGKSIPGDSTFCPFCGKKQ